MNFEENTEKISREEIIENFKKGNIVFKVMYTESDCQRSLQTHEIVTTVIEYKEKLSTHIHTELLYMCTFEERMAYIYGCLNEGFPPNFNREYIFMWRKLKTEEWNEWFRVSISFSEINIFGKREFIKFN